MDCRHSLSSRVGGSPRTAMFCAAISVSEMHWGSCAPTIRTAHRFCVRTVRKDSWAATDAVFRS